MTNPPVSRYQQVADQLRAEIQSGTYAPGEALPSESSLAERFSLNRTTINKAVRQLAAQGLVRVEHGRGAFVREHRELVRLAADRYQHGASDAPHRREAKAGGWTDEFTADLTETSASPAIAVRLGIEEGQAVSQAVYTRRVNGELVQVSTQWEPLSITRGTSAEAPSDGSLGSPDVITRFDRIGIRITHVTEVIRSRVPTPEERDRLSLGDATPVLAIERTHWADDLPVETADIVIRGDRTAIENRQVVHRPTQEATAATA